MAYIKGGLLGSFERVKRPPMRKSRQDIVEKVLGGMRPGAGPRVQPGQFDLGSDFVRHFPPSPVRGYGRADAMDRGNAAGMLPSGAGDEYGPDALGNGMIRPYSSPTQRAVQPPWEGQLGRQSLDPRVLALVQEMLSRGGGLQRPSIPSQRFYGGGMF